MLFISQHHEIVLVVGAEISSAVSFRVRVKICPHHFVRERQLYLTAAAVHYVGVKKIDSAFICLILHDHPESEFFVLLFVVIGHYRSKARSYRS